MPGKTYPRFRGRTRGPSTRTLQRTKANKRFDSFAALFISPCDPLVLEFHQCPDVEVDGPVPGRLVLVGNDELEDRYSDSATVVRMFGTLYFQPIFNPVEGADSQGTFIDARKASYLFRGGVYTAQANMQDGTLDTPIANPLEVSSDWTDLAPMKKFEKCWLAGQGASLTLKHNQPGATFGVCPNVTMPSFGAVENTLTSGSGVVNIGPITTDCTAFTFPGSPTDAPDVAGLDQHVLEPRPFRLNFSTRKRRKLLGNKGLVFDFNYGPAFSVDGTPPEVGFVVFGAVGVTLEF